MPGRTPEGDAVTDLVLPVFELAGALERAAASITEDTEITPAMWKVLGLIIDEPLPVAEIAKRLGHARQSVQRLANLAVEMGAAEWRDNPEHERSNLLVLSPGGRTLLATLVPRQHAWANAVGSQVGKEELESLAKLVDDFLHAIRAATKTGQD